MSASPNLVLADKLQLLALLEEKKRRSTVVVHNTGSIQELEQSVRRALGSILGLSISEVG